MSGSLPELIFFLLDADKRSMCALPLPAAGWFPDSNNPQQVRWWDGHQWTGHVKSVEEHRTATENLAGAAHKVEAMHDDLLKATGHSVSRDEKGRRTVERQTIFGTTNRDTDIGWGFQHEERESMFGYTEHSLSFNPLRLILNMLLSRGRRK